MIQKLSINVPNNNNFLSNVEFSVIDILYIVSGD